jgi:hypothetical protein
MAVPMKAEYGPTLGQLLAPRWRAASRALRWGTIAAGAAVVAIVIAAALTLENARYSHGGPVPFSFSYRGLYRTTPDPDGYVKVQSVGADGALRYSYAVEPLNIPAYSGDVFGELPLYASTYIETLRRRDADFQLRGEGKTRVNANMVGYQVLYTTEVRGREVYGRDVMLLPHSTGGREGVVLEMLTSATADAGINSPLEVAGSGVLLRPLKTFSFG